jgi:hypothetical protein
LNFSQEGANVTLRERENQIFRKYRSLGPAIIPDGALGEEYESARRRLMVILKEPNDPDGRWAAEGGDIRFFGKEKQDCWRTWSNLARWSALVDNPSLSLEEIDVSDREKRCEHLRRIAVVNLKKTPGGSRANLREIKASAAKHWDLLREQIGLYKPEVTIAGGVFDIVLDLMGSAKQGGAPECFPYFKDEDFGVCLDFYHPQQTSYTKEKLFGFLRSQLNYHKLR